MHVISLIVRIRLPLVSSQSDQYQKSYGCFSYSDVVGRARSRVKWSIWRAISSTTEQIEMSFGMMAPNISTDIMSKGFWVTWSISGWSAPWSAGIRYFTVFFSVWTRFARHSANTWNGDTKLGMWSHIGLSDPQCRAAVLARTKN